jgi:hypothetical protein
MSSQHTDNPAIVYQQIEHQAEEESCPQQDEVEMVYSAENQAIIDNSTKWVFLLVTVQMVLTILCVQRVIRSADSLSSLLLKCS